MTLSTCSRSALLAAPAKRAAANRPAPPLNSIGFATNWQSGRSCEGTSKHGGNIDGWAYMPAAHQLVDHGCLEYGLSDHRPVWITVRPVMAEE